MKSLITLIAFTTLLIAGCGGEQNAADENQESVAAKKSSVFGGLTVSIGKTKGTQQAVNGRKTRMDEALGYDPSTETRRTLGMTETSR